MKTIESQGKKQVKAPEEHGKQLAGFNENKKYGYDDVSRELLNQKKLMIFLKKGKMKY